MNENESLEFTEVTNMSESIEELPEVYTEVVEVVQDDTHYFMTTHLDDYTVTEGLLLLILVLLVVKWIGKAIKEGFYWLL